MTSINNNNASANTFCAEFIRAIASGGVINPWDIYSHQPGANTPVAFSSEKEALAIVQEIFARVAIPGDYYRIVPVGDQTGWYKIPDGESFYIEVFDTTDASPHSIGFAVE